MSKTKESVLTENMGELTMRFLNETITASPHQCYNDFKKGVSKRHPSSNVKTREP